MADAKVTALTALTGVAVANDDQWVVVDVSDTTQASSGSTKKISTAEASLVLSGWQEAEIDFGTQPTWSKTFTISATGLTSANMVAVNPSGKPATGRSPGDDEWDGIIYSAVANSDSFTLMAIAFPGPIEGKRTIIYAKAV